jgi:hypothetical protein
MKKGEGEIGVGCGAALGVALRWQGEAGAALEGGARPPVATSLLRCGRRKKGLVGPGGLKG